MYLLILFYVHLISNVCNCNLDVYNFMQVVKPENYHVKGIHQCISVSTDVTASRL